MSTSDRTFDPLNCSALQLAAALAARQADAEEVAERTLAAVRDCGDAAIFTCLTPERAAAEARAASRRLREGRALSLLDGVPVAWKDLFDLKGLATRAGSRGAGRDPPAAVRTRRWSPISPRPPAWSASARVNMTEFAYSGLGLNPHYGTPRNPHGKRAAARSGRIVVGLGGRGGARPRAGRDRHRHRRLGAPAGGVQWHRRLQIVCRALCRCRASFRCRARWTRSACSRAAPSTKRCWSTRRCAGASHPCRRRGRWPASAIAGPANVVFDDASRRCVANFEAALDASGGGGRRDGAHAACRRSTRSSSSLPEAARSWPRKPTRCMRERLEGEERRGWTVASRRAARGRARSRWPDYVTVLRASGSA